MQAPPLTVPDARAIQSVWSSRGSTAGSSSMPAARRIQALVCQLSTGSRSGFTSGRSMSRYFAKALTNGSYNPQLGQACVGRRALGQWQPGLAERFRSRAKHSGGRRSGQSVRGCRRNTIAKSTAACLAIANVMRV